MQIVVASGNIFRRELTSYILSEAGYCVSEARDLAGLLAALVGSTPLAMIVDAQLLKAGAGTAGSPLPQRSDIPLLWIATPGHEPLPAEAGGRPSDQVAWPFRPESLLERLAALLARVKGGLLEGAPSERLAGPAE